MLPVTSSRLVTRLCILYNALLFSFMGFIFKGIPHLYKVLRGTKQNELTFFYLPVCLREAQSAKEFLSLSPVGLLQLICNAGDVL